MVGQLHHVAEAEIAERIHTDDFSDLRNRVVVGDELVFVVNIRAVVAFGHKGRRADPHVDLLRAGLAQQVDGAAASGAPDDGIIDQHHALALHHGADGVQLDIDLIFPHILRGRNKGAADVFVFDKAHAVGDPGLTGVAHGGVQTGVRHADDDVRLHGSERLSSDMKTRLGVIADIREKISERAPLVVEEQRKKLNERIESLLSETEIDRARLATEIALFADKVSIDEELVRLSSHIAAAGELLENSGSVGRKLDFIVQEMNREFNTIGSKANDKTIASLVIDGKAELEKMREQVQNFE